MNFCSLFQDEDSLRNNVNNRLSSLDSTTVNGHHLNGHHHYNGSKEDGHSSMNTTSTTNGSHNNNNHHHNELNSLWIESRAVSIFFFAITYNQAHFRVTI